MEYAPLISFILPVYNVEKYLPTCIDSLLAQSYQNLEIILVDDGSPDSCPDICDRYSVQDDRICVLHQRNGGLSDARNEGLRRATGDYVIFLDSDDFHYNPRFVEELVGIIWENPVDMVMFKRTYCTGNGEIVRELPLFDERVNQYATKDEMLFTLAERDELECNASLKMFRHELFVEHDIFFKSGIVSEDVEWFLRVIPHLSSLYVSNIKSYGYRIREGSITQTVGEKNIQDLLTTVEEVSSRWKHESDTMVKKVILNYVAYQFFILLGYLQKLPGTMRVQYYRRMREVSWVTKYVLSKKNKKANLFYKVLGMKCASYILGVYIQKKKRDNAS